ncbi:MAG: hypothetical protein AAGA35_03925 [Patescibacteria group bacterium]
MREPENPGPTKAEFVKIVAKLAAGGNVHGTVLRRLKGDKGEKKPEEDPDD